MKWMLYDREKKELSFKLEEHEIVDEMQHYVIFVGPTAHDTGLSRQIINSETSKVNSKWILKFKIPEKVLGNLHLGQWDFIVLGEGDKKLTRPDYIVASGFSNAMHFVCHQALAKRT
jgi:hypothetical protein